MWIYTNRAFLSIVAHRDDPKVFLVRARLPQDIEAVFPRAEVVFTPEADYAFRARIPRGEVAEALSILALQIDYDNFKESIEQLDRYRAYHEVWARTKTALSWLVEQIAARRAKLWGDRKEVDQWPS